VPPAVFRDNEGLPSFRERKIKRKIAQGFPAFFLEKEQKHSLRLPETVFFAYNRYVMSALLFGFQAPTHENRKDDRTPVSAFTFLKVKEDGVLSYRYVNLYKNQEWRPANAYQNEPLPADVFAEIQKILADNHDFIVSYAKACPRCAEDRKHAFALVHFGESEFFVPDYVLDARDTTYLSRYDCYPNPDTQKAYQIIRSIVSLINTFVKSLPTRPLWVAS
jgi:hypothetical protein